MTGEHAVVLDTDVYSALHVTAPEKVQRQGHPVEEWRTALRGRRVVIAFQTRAEVLAGARSARWGDRKMQTLEAKLETTPTVGLDEDVLEAYVTLTVEARASGAAIGQKVHNGDRWIAACAIAKSLPLLSGDGIFRGAPSLMLLDVPSSSSEVTG